MSEKQTLPLATLCTEAGLSPPPLTEHIDILGVTSDSRRVSQGYLFVAIRGFHTDGTRYIPQAVARGAVAIVAPSGTSVPAGVVHIPHEAPRLALAYLCDAWYGHPAKSFTLVGVTGTNGKTSVSAMLAHILKCAGIPVGVIGTVGTVGFSGQPLCIRSLNETANMTTPDPEELYAILAAMAEEGKGYDERPVVVMEVTSHALLLDKTAPLTFDWAIFTNLTPEHLDMHGSMEEYYTAKRRLFTSCRTAVVNADDPFGERLIGDPETAAETWYVCHTSPMYQCVDTHHAGRCCNRVYAGQIKLMGAAGIEYRLMSPRVRLRVSCPVPGSFTVVNSMEAAVTAISMGVSPIRVKEALLTFSGVPGRMERVPLGDHVGFSVFLDYAHTPDALENLLTTAMRFRRRGERIVLLFGCGGDRDPSKRPLMAAVASRMADTVIVTSDNSRTEDPMTIISDILSGMDPTCDHVIIPDRREAIRYAVRYARMGDIILLAGKGHETYEIDKNGRRPFSERALVTEAADLYHPKQHG